MSANFDWQTEEGGWEYIPPQDERPAEPKRRPWRALFLFCLFLALIGAFLYQRASQRVDQAMAAVEADVLAGYNLVWHSVARTDHELFVTLLSGRNPRWTTIQLDLLEKGMLLDRSPLGLKAQASIPQITAINIAPNLSEAEVVAQQAYTIDAGNGVTDTVQLQQTGVFRRGGQQWLLSPPESDFWGQWMVNEGSLLTLTFPARDEAISRRLALDLDAKLGDMCATLADINCPAALQVHLRLETDPTALLELADAKKRVIGSRNIVLPTPTLVGLPLDEAAYQALYRGYAEFLLSPVITDLVAWNCCLNHGLFYQALLTKQLNQLAIRPSPLAAADYEQIVNGGVSLGAMNALWFAPLTEDPAGQELQQAMAATDFLLDEAERVSPAAMQRQLSMRTNYWSWLQQWLAGDGFHASDDAARNMLERKWMRFVTERSLSAQRPSPVPWPDQDIQLLCHTNTQQEASLYRYDLATDSWHTDLSDRSLLFMSALPDDTGIVLEERFLAEDDTTWQKRIIVWQEGQEMVAFTGPMRSGIIPSFDQSDPMGQHLRLYTFDNAEGPLTFHYLDLDRCNEAGCLDRVVPGFPIWSPDGSRTIFWNDTTLFLGDGDGASQSPIGSGFAPFWLDAETYGYIDAGASDAAVQAVEIASIGKQAETLVQTTDLLAAIAEADRPNELSISYVAVHPADQTTLLIAATSSDGAAPQVYIFSFKRVANPVRAEGWPQTPSPPFMEDISLLQQVDDNFAGHPPFHFSPDGRWLTTLTYGWRHPARVLYLLDLVDGQTKSFASPPSFLRYDWSSDSQWFLRTEEGFITLLAPAYDYRRLIFHDFSDCPFVAWVKR